MSNKRVITIVLVIALVIYLIWSYRKKVHLFSKLDPTKMDEDSIIGKKVMTVVDAQVYLGSLDWEVEDIMRNQEPVFYPADHVVGVVLQERDGWLEVATDTDNGPTSKIIPKSKVKVVDNGTV